jgi:TRAP-type transport system periplasmic protein
MKKLWVLPMIVFILVSFNIGTVKQSQGAQPEITLTWADYASPGFDQLNYVNHYIDRIREETQGRVEIKLYPAQQLVKAMQQYEAVMQGTIDMSNLTPVYYAGKIPLLCLSSEAAYWEPGDSVVITSRTAREIDAVLARDGIKFMGWSTELPPICTIGPKFFKQPDDFKGMKIRAPGRATTIINSWGGTGVSISAAETYMAIQRGVVDGAYTTIGSIEGSRLWEVTSHVTFSNTGGTPQLIVMNMDKWNSLPEDIKAVLEKVNREMVPWAYDHALNYTKKTEELLKSNFKEWYRLNAEEEAVLQEPASGYIWKPAVERFGEPAQQLWDKILSVAAESQEARSQGKIPRFFED